MSIILDGTNGITTPDVDSTTSVTTPLVTSSGALALSTTSANAITASTNGAERMRITSAGNVGIGTSSPVSRLDIFNSSSSIATRTGIKVRDNAQSGTNVLAETKALHFFAAANTETGYVSFEHNQGFGQLGSTNIAAVGGGRVIKFLTSGSERMRIDASGNLLVGKTALNDTTSGFAWANGRINITNANGPVGLFNRQSSNGALLIFRRNNNDVGSVSVTTASTSYNTSSDYRLKENVVPLAGAADRLMQIPVHRFNFIADPDTTVDGFLAHEVQPYVPEAITGTKDEVDDEGNPVHQGIDQSKLVPLLTAALQEALQKIEALETRISALETPA